MKAINKLTQINKMGGGKNPTSSACCFAIHNHIIPYTNVSGRLVASIPDAAGRSFFVGLARLISRVFADAMCGMGVCILSVGLKAHGYLHCVHHVFQTFAAVCADEAV